MQGSSAGEFADLLDAVREGEGGDAKKFAETWPEVADRLESQGAYLSKGRDTIEWDDATPSIH